MNSEQNFKLFYILFQVCHIVAVEVRGQLLQWVLPLPLRVQSPWTHCAHPTGGQLSTVLVCRDAMLLNFGVNLSGIEC